jgi:glycosyltransferase involved in cell wall biosynthesis
VGRALKPFKFSIVTPSYNAEEYIAETIQSVISQRGDFEIEYTIADGASSDGTVGVIERYDNLLREGHFPVMCRSVTLRWQSQKDAGMYDAVNKGFATATGDVYAYINADDVYLPGAFEIVRRTFEKYAEIRWLKGITAYTNPLSLFYRPGQCNLYDQRLIQRGVYGRDIYFIQQDSVFWRGDLWREVGGIDTSLVNAGDYYLWLEFSKRTPLYSLNVPVSCFRHLDVQLTGDGSNYHREANRLSPSMPAWSFLLRVLYSPRLRLPHWLQYLVQCVVTGGRCCQYVDLDEGGMEPMLRRSRRHVWRRPPDRLVPGVKTLK